MPFFDPTKEVFLEYDIAKLLYELNQTHKPEIAILTSLPVQGNPALGEQPWAAIQQLGQLFTLRTLDPATLERVDPSIKVLLLIHPGALPPAAQYAVDQYVLGGGHLALFVDPIAEMARPALGVPDAAVQNDTGIARLLTAWGVVYDPHRVVLDRARALQIELGGSSFNHPAMLDLGTAELNREDVITSSLQRINVSTAGHFDLAPNAATRLSPLLQTSAEAQAVPRTAVEAAAGDPTQLLRGYALDAIERLGASSDELDAQELHVPGDLSSAAFMIEGCAAPGGGSGSISGRGSPTLPRRRSPGTGTARPRRRSASTTPRLRSRSAGAG